MYFPAWLVYVLSWCLLGCRHHVVASSQPNLCFLSCRASLKPVTFNDTHPEVEILVHPCRTPLATKSMYLCLAAYCDAYTLDEDLAELNATCISGGKSPIPPFSIIANYTAGDIERLRHILVDETLSPFLPVVNEVVVPSRELYIAWIDTFHAVEYVNGHHFLYGAAMVVFWVAVVLVGAANRITLASLRLCQRDRLCRKQSPSQTTSWFKRRLLTPATFGYKCATEVWCGTIPPRIQTITIVAFALINIALSIHGYRIIPVNMYFPSRTKQILRYVSDRTGIISFANFPIIWLFGMRNNVAIWLTGWDFGTYNNFHRWVARIATLQAVIHSIGYTVLIFMDGPWEYYVSYWTQLFWNTGVAATVFMCVLMACSIYWLRRQQYELFLLLHIGMSITVLVTMLGHVSIFKGRYDGLFWVPAFIWLFDRSLRVLRIFAFNPSLKPTVANATYTPSSNIVRLEVPCRARTNTFAPGTYYYLSVINDKRCWESHPFTVASVTPGPASDKTSDEQAHLLQRIISNPNDQQGPGSSRLTFLIRPYDGFTSRIRDAAAQLEDLRVLVDGPYGHSLPLQRFGRIIFIVGGSGVVMALSYLKLLTNHAASNKSISVHWAIRESAFAADVISNDMGEALADGGFHLHLYFSIDSCRAMDADIPSQVSRCDGRPDARQIILNAAAAAGKESLAVVACGPARMADDARSAVVEAMEGGMCEIELFEESFRW